MDNFKSFNEKLKNTPPSPEQKFIFVIDSKQRDCDKFPNPANYKIHIGDVYKNISSIELKGVILPKSSYNVHSTNKYIDFVIGDSVTSYTITNPGSGYTIPPSVTISSSSGTTATATATLNSSGGIASINIVNPGSGYSNSNPPTVTISQPPYSQYSINATAVANIGTVYTATIREGNYTIGGNPSATSSLPSGLLLEIQNAMNYAVNGGNYNPTSTSPFAVRVVNQYPTIDAVPGTPEAFDTNSTLFNRIQITNVNNDPWEILWCSGKNSIKNMRRILGFEWKDSSSYKSTSIVTSSNGTLIPAGTTYRGLYDYDLKDDPKYVILSFWAYQDEAFERVQSTQTGGLHRTFATLLYDSNNPENLYDLSGSAIETINNVRYLTGNADKGTFYNPPAPTKPLRGLEFDQKKIEFSPPLGKMSYLNIKFSKYGQNSSSDLNDCYDFQGRDHLLMFEITTVIQNV